MAKLSSDKIAARARERIKGIQDTLAQLDYLCSGTLLKSLMKCGKENCRCHVDPDARHGPYYRWGHMKNGKLIHRYVSPDQAEILSDAIANYRKAKKLMLEWEAETERLIDAQTKPKP